MTTTVVKTIGSTGDYSTLQAWEDACPADLTAVDQIWQGQCQNQTFTAGAGVEVLMIAGTTADANRYLHLTAVAGASFRDNIGSSNPLRADASYGALLTGAQDYKAVIRNSVEGTRISNLMITRTTSGTVNPALDMGAAADGSAHCFVDNCIIEGNRGPSGLGVAALYGSSQIIRNSLVVLRADSFQAAVVALRAGAQAFNCTFAVPHDLPFASAVNNGAYGSPSFTNCAFFGGSASLLNTGGGTPTYTTCMSESGTTTGVSAASSSTSFVDVNDATRDYRLVTGSALINAGTTDTTNAATDIVGTTRPQGSAYDVGAWEFIPPSARAIPLLGQVCL